MCRGCRITCGGKPSCDEYLSILDDCLRITHDLKKLTDKILSYEKSVDPQYEKIIRRFRLDVKSVRLDLASAECRLNDINTGCDE